MTSREREIIELAIELVGIHDKLWELEVYGQRKDFQLWGDDFIDLFKDTEIEVDIEVDIVDKERNVAIFRKRVEIGDNIIVFYNIPNLERNANPLYLEAYNKALEALDEAED